MSDKVGILILAGGQATRMGGGDKCLLPLGDKRILDHVLDRANHSGHPIALNANGASKRFAEFDLPVLADPIKGFAGPLSGVLAGLEWANERGLSGIVTLAADTPMFPHDLVDTLVSNATRPDMITFAKTQSDEGRWFAQPTFAYWPTTLRPSLELALQEGVRKIMQFVKAHPNVGVEFADESAFFNINTPQDLATAEALLKDRK